MDTPLGHQLAPACGGAKKGVSRGSVVLPPQPVTPTQALQVPRPTLQDWALSTASPGTSLPLRSSHLCPRWPWRTPPCLTLRFESSLVPGASPPVTRAGAEGPAGRPLQACHPFIRSVQTRPGLVSVSQTPGRAPPADPGPAGRTCVAQKGTTALPGSCGPLMTTGTPEECSICAPIKRPAVKTEPQWAGDGKGKSGLTTPRDSDTVSTEHQGTCRRLAASWGAWLLHPGPGTRDSWGVRTGPCLGRTFSAQERVHGHSRAGHVPAEVPSASSFLLQLETGPAHRGHGHPSPRHTLPAGERGLKVPQSVRSPTCFSVIRNQEKSRSGCSLTCHRGSSISCSAKHSPSLGGSHLGVLSDQATRPRGPANFRLPWGGSLAHQVCFKNGALPAHLPHLTLFFSSLTEMRVTSHTIHPFKG